MKSILTIACCGGSEIDFNSSAVTSRPIRSLAHFVNASSLIKSGRSQHSAGF